MSSFRRKEDRRTEGGPVAPTAIVSTDSSALRSAVRASRREARRGNEVDPVLTPSPFAPALPFHDASAITPFWRWPAGTGNERRRLVTVPVHPELAKGTLLSVLRQAGLSREEFLRLARR